MARIITHAGCVDGYSSAYIFKFFLGEKFGILPNEITEVIGVQPRDVQEESFTFTKEDIVLDLPRPKSCKLWFDHHSSNKPDVLNEGDFFRITPSCASLLIDIAKEKGVVISEEMEEFKLAIDKVDDAQYTREDIKDCYYSIESYDKTSMLQKIHVIDSMISTKDFHLSKTLFSFLLEQKGSTPVTGDVWNIHPELFHIARVANLDEWRRGVDKYLEFNEPSRTVVQDDRQGRVRGSTDHFYPFIKFPESAYNLLIRPTDDLTIIRIGSNIFNKERRTVDIGSLCREVGRKFGAGSGGGHDAVGGASIHPENTDAAKEFILESLKN